jgi:hypothetical protein
VKKRALSVEKRALFVKKIAYTFSVKNRAHLVREEEKFMKMRVYLVREKKSLPFSCEES